MHTEKKPSKQYKGVLRVIGSRPQLVVVVVLLVSISSLIWITGHTNLQNNLQNGLVALHVGYMPRFPGSLGKAAFDKLVKWNDELFMSTMTMYKLKAQDLCTKDKDGCEAATDRRRPPEPSAFEMYDLFNPYISSALMVLIWRGSVMRRMVVNGFAPA